MSSNKHFSSLSKFFVVCSFTKGPKTQWFELFDIDWSFLDFTSTTIVFSAHIRNESLFTTAIIFSCRTCNCYCVPAQTYCNYPEPVAPKNFNIRFGNYHCITFVRNALIIYTILGNKDNFTCNWVKFGFTRSISITNVFTQSLRNYTQNYGDRSVECR